METRCRIGLAALLAALPPAAGLVASDDAAAAPSDYEFVLIASENDPGFVANGFLDLAINDLGQVAYTRARDVNSPTFDHGGAVLLGDGTTTVTIVDGSTPLPPGSFFVTFLNLGDPGSGRFWDVDLNDSGQVVFQAELNNRASPPRIGDTGFGVFATDLDGNLVEIGVGDNDCCGPEPEFAAVGGAAINDRGVVALAVREQTPGEGSEPALVVARSTHDPAGSSAVLLEDYNDTVFDPDLGRSVGTQTRLDLVCDLDDTGAVVASGYYSFVPAVGDPVMGTAVVSGPSVPPTPLVIGGSSAGFYLGSDALPAIGNGDLVAFLGLPTTGDGTSLYGVDRMGGAAAPLVTASTPLDQVAKHDVNDLGAFVFSAWLDDFAGSGAYTGPDLDLDRVLATGDVVLGRPIDDVLDVRINDHGQVALFVRFADDGSEAILRADPVDLPDRGPCAPSLPGVLAEDCLPALAAELETASPVTISRTLSLDGDETAVAFALRFLGSEGSLSMTLEGANPTAISAEDLVPGEFVQRVVHLPAPVSGEHELAFTLEGPAGALAQIADVQLLVGAAADPIAGGAFVDETGQPFANLADAGWTIGGDGSAALVTLPEPDAGVLVAGFALLALAARSAREGRSRTTSRG